MMSLLKVTSPISHVIPSTGSKTQNVLAIDLMGKKPNTFAKVYHIGVLIVLLYTVILRQNVLSYF